MGGGGGGGGGSSYGPAGTVFTADAHVGDGFVYATLLPAYPVVVTGSQRYGSSSSTFTTATAPPSGDSFSGTLSCSTVNGGTAIARTLAAGSYTIDGSSCSGLSLTGPTASDYAIVYSGSGLTVSQAPLTVNAPSASAQYGNVPGTFTPSYTGLVNGQSSPSVRATCTSTATNASQPGTYPITCSGASDSNYAIAYGPAGTLTIVKAQTQVTAAPAAHGLLTITFSAKLTRVDNGGAIVDKGIAFSVRGQKVCAASTGGTGVATCTVLGLALVPATYTATFGGQSGYLGSSGIGKL
jgi:hypothetical protein